jgi:PASTA domain-containing protein
MVEARRIRVFAVVLLALAVGCTQATPTSSPSASASVASEHHDVSDRILFSPKRAKLVGTVRAPEPPGDNVEAFKPIMLDFYKIACPDVLSVQSEIRSEGSKEFIVVRCGHRPTRSVRVIYTGVTIPDLVGGSAHDLIDVGAMLGIHIHESTRPVRHGEESNTVVAQDPPGGSVVPFGSTMTVVVANYTN